MSATGECLCRMGKSLLVFSLLCLWAAQTVSPFAPDFICLYIPGLNARQVEVCRQVPAAMNILTAAEETFAVECEWQFRKERWNCTGISPPIYHDPDIPENKESAFVYSLTSAVVVHQITQACSHDDLPTCGCDTSRNDEETAQGWTWGSCSDDVNYGVTFAQDFLDAREFDIDHSNDSQVATALVHLHNNAAGRRAVQDNMKLVCKCHGLSGSCAVKTCWKELPNLFEVGDILREKYSNAIKVQVHTQRNGGEGRLQYLDPESGQYELPPNTELVYVETSTNHCAVYQQFTRGRHCIAQASVSETLGEDTEPLGTYFAPCEHFCCNREYNMREVEVTYSCNCRFVWCCEVVCQTCTQTVREYKCTG